MIWFDIKVLEHKLKSGDMSDKEFFNYLLASMILYAAVPYASNNDYHAKWLLTIEMVIAVIITVIGTKMTFDINSRGDSKDYFKRFFALSFVVAVRLIVFIMIAAIPIVLIVKLWVANTDTNETLNDFFNLAASLIVSLVYYFMLTNSFKRVSQQTTIIN